VRVCTATRSGEVPIHRRVPARTTFPSRAHLRSPSPPLAYPRVEIEHLDTAPSPYTFTPSPTPTPTPSPPRTRDHRGLLTIVLLVTLVVRVPLVRRLRAAGESAAETFPGDCAVLPLLAELAWLAGVTGVVGGLHVEPGLGLVESWMGYIETRGRGAVDGVWCDHGCCDCGCAVRRAMRRWGTVYASQCGLSSTQLGL